MTAAALPRDAFAPRPPPGMRSGFGLAFAVHVLLVLALAWSVNWKTSEPEGVVAELWSALPQSAAPRPVTPEPRPPVVEPRPAPPPPPPRPEPAATPREDAQIAVERAAREKQKRAEVERAEAARQAERTRRDELKRAQEEQQRQRLADEQTAKKKEAEQARAAETKQAAIREANLKRMMSQAGESSDANATGTAARTSGPSASYAGRIKARIKPNIVLTGEVAGNPTCEVEVRVAPDGTIVGRKLMKGSGSALWDQTVLRAIDKTEVLPRDTDGRVPAVISMTFRPIE